MKNSETDRELIDLIKDTLDKYEEEYILGSWENYVRKRKRRKKLILWFCGTGIAASLLIGWIGIRFFLSGSFGSNADRQQQSISNLEILVDKDTLKEQILIRHIPALSEEKKKKESLSHDLTLQHINEPRRKNQTNDKEESLHALNLASKSEGNSSEPDAGIYPTGKNMSELTPDTSGNKPANRPIDVKITPEEDLTDNARSLKFRFGVNLAPGITSTNTSSSFSYSGGISADYALSRSLRLSTGLQVEHQNVINKGTDNPAWIPSGQTQAELVDIDLPLNIIWKFLIRKSASYYLSGGISSVVYLSEKYTSTSYSQKMVQAVEMKDEVSNMTYQLENVKTAEQRTEAPLNSFDFASRINIIFGYEHHLSSRLFLHIEPYIKIPVSELATQNLRFTTSGITCKISF